MNGQIDFSKMSVHMLLRYIELENQRTTCTLTALIPFLPRSVSNCT